MLDCIHIGLNFRVGNAGFASVGCICTPRFLAVKPATFYSTFCYLDHRHSDSWKVTFFLHFPPSLPVLPVLLHPGFTHHFHSPLSLSPLNSARRSEGEVRYKLTKVPSEKCRPVSKVGGIRIMHLVPTISKTGGDASHLSQRVAAPMISTRPKGRVWAVMIAALCCIVYDKSINQSLIY